MPCGSLRRGIGRAGVCQDTALTHIVGALPDCDLQSGVSG